MTHLNDDELAAAERAVLDGVRDAELVFKWGEKGADPRILIVVPMELREALAAVREKP